MLDGYCMDIGGTSARIYEVCDSVCVRTGSVTLPLCNAYSCEEEASVARTEAIAELVSDFSIPDSVRSVPTACAGLKNAERTGVVLLYFAVPLPHLAEVIKERTGIWTAPLYDDDVAACWGHVASPRSPLAKGPENALVLTAGTGLAEAHWVEGTLVDKDTYPRARDLGLEERLRADGWRDTGDPTEALKALFEARSRLYRLERVILSGRFVHLSDEIVCRLPEHLGVPVDLVDLPEAPALGALYLLQASARS